MSKTSNKHIKSFAIAHWDQANNALGPLCKRYAAMALPIVKSAETINKQ